jgi:hypothetical protein
LCRNRIDTTLAAAIIILDNDMRRSGKLIFQAFPANVRSGTEVLEGCHEPIRGIQILGHPARVLRSAERPVVLVVGKAQ